MANKSLFTPLESLAGRHGEQFGNALGNPIHQALDALAQQKVSHLEQRQYAKGLEGFVPAPIAHLASLQQPKDRAEFLQNIGPLLDLYNANNQGNQYTQQQAQQFQQQLTAQPAQQSQQQEPPSQQGFTAANLITSPLTSDAVRNAMSKLQLFQPQQQQPADQQQEQDQPSAQQMNQPQQQRPLNQQQSIPDQSELIKNAFMSPKQKIELQKAQRKEQQVEQHNIDKETLKSYNAVVSEERAAGKADQKLDRLDTLIRKEGGLPFAPLYKLLTDLEKIRPEYGAVAGGLAGKTIGGTHGALVGAAIGGLAKPIASLLKSVQQGTSPNTAEYEQILTDFVREAKNIFGSRITNFDLEQFMKTLPELSINDAGKLKIIENMKLFNKAAHIRFQVMEDLIKENGGKRPKNMDLLIEERSAPLLDAAAEEFKTGVKQYEKEKQGKNQADRYSKAAQRQGELLIGGF